MAKTGSLTHAQSNQKWYKNIARPASMFSLRVQPIIKSQPQAQVSNQYLYTSSDILCSFIGYSEVQNQVDFAKSTLNSEINS